MTRRLLTATISLALLAAAGCGGGGSDGGGGGGGTTTISFAQDVQPIFTTYCIDCHTPGGEGEFMNLNSGFAYVSLVNIPSTMTVGGGNRVTPSDSANSVLWKRVSGIGLDVSDETMPKGGTLPAAEKNVLLDWINQGALNN